MGAAREAERTRAFAHPASPTTALLAILASPARAFSPSGLPCLHRVEQIGRPRQAADMGGENPVGAGFQVPPAVRRRSSRRAWCDGVNDESHLRDAAGSAEGNAREDTSMPRAWSSALIGLCLLASPAHAQSDYPSKPVKIIVPSAPGGGTDIAARVLAQHLSQSLGQQFFIDNRPGAGNMIGIEAAARSAPDGYTLLMTASTLSINQLTYKKVLYDAVRDFAPISLVVSLPSVLVVHPSVPARSLAELIALAKQKPDQLTYASAGTGTNPHLSMELLKTMVGIEIRHIPYRGVGPALNDLVAGQVSTLIAGVLTTKPQVDAGTVRGLAVTGLKRVESLPDVPTVAEAGVPTYEALQWYGLLAPAGTPAPIIARLHAETAKAVRSVEMKERLAADGADPVGNTPAEFAAHIKDEMRKWAEVARAAKIEPQ
jgi:tripartite-type tricarboxylate transporter receptor subunit TctC